MSGQSLTTLTGEVRTEQVKTSFRTMTIIHIPLVTGVALFAGFVFTITYCRMTFSPAYQNPVVLVTSNILPAGMLVLCAAVLAKGRSSHSMATVITRSAVVEAAGTPPRRIEEFFGRVNCSSPRKDGAESVAICLPAFSPETVHRDE
jgi:hypothetical protein